MMAIDVKRLNEAGKIDLTRCYEAADRVMAERRVDAELLAAASLNVEGKRSWFALRTWKCSEIDLCRMLVDSRVDAVVPKKTVPVKRRFGALSRTVIHKPVLAGLVFVSIVPSPEAYAGLLRVSDVQAIVGDGVLPYPIGSNEMNGFMELAEKGAFDERNMPTGLKVGSRVRIKVGPYADLDGVLEGYAPGRPARVLTHLFGGKMTVDVTLAHLEKLE